LSFFIDLKILWKELESLRPTSNCVCETRCSYALIKNVVKHKESQHIMCFLKSFNDAYVIVKTQIWRVWLSFLFTWRRCGKNLNL